MMRRAFTLVELLAAILLLGVMTTFAVLTFNAVTTSWTVSGEYMDKIQRTDYALDQLVVGLRSAYYPHEGEQSYDYGFRLDDMGDGKDPRNSDTIEWAKTGNAIVGNQDATADTVHRVQVMVLEEGNSDFREEIKATGLYARMCPDAALRPKAGSSGTEDMDIDYSFANDRMYQPVLVADGVVGMNCRVMKAPESEMDQSRDSKEKFEDEWEASNSIPYKVELTFRIADPEGKSYRSHTAPVMRIVRLPLYEQSQDAAALPGGQDSGKRREE